MWNLHVLRMCHTGTFEIFTVKLGIQISKASSKKNHEIQAQKKPCSIPITLNLD